MYSMRLACFTTKLDFYSVPRSSNRCLWQNTDCQPVEPRYSEEEKIAYNLNFVGYMKKHKLAKARAVAPTIHCRLCKTALAFANLYRGPIDTSKSMPYSAKRVRDKTRHRVQISRVPRTSKECGNKEKISDYLDLWSVSSLEYPAHSAASIFVWFS